MRLRCFFMYNSIYSPSAELYKPFVSLKFPLSICLSHYLIMAFFLINRRRFYVWIAVISCRNCLILAVALWFSYDQYPLTRFIWLVSYPSCSIPWFHRNPGKEITQTGSTNPGQVVPEFKTGIPFGQRGKITVSEIQNHSNTHTHTHKVSNIKSKWGET